MPKLIEESGEAIYGAIDVLSGDHIGTVIFNSEHLFPTEAHYALGSEKDACIAATKEICRQSAEAVLAYLTSHGFLTLDAIVAIQAEKDGK